MNEYIRKLNEINTWEEFFRFIFHFKDLLLAAYLVLMTGSRNRYYIHGEEVIKLGSSKRISSP